jgi:hypothetical protein
MFEKLLSITYVSFIKIMISVRLTSEKRKLTIKKIDPEYFVHMCYKKAAIELFKKPEIFAKNVSESEREVELTERFTVVIKKTMDEMIPMQQILLNLMADDEERFNFNDEEQPQEEEEPQEPPEGQEPMDPIDALPEEAPTQPAEQPPQEPAEMKSIPVSQPAHPQEESLFDDAAEKTEGTHPD